MNFLLVLLLSAAGNPVTDVADVRPGGDAVLRLGGMLPVGNVAPGAALREITSRGLPVTLGFDLPLTRRLWWELGFTYALIDGNAGCPPIFDCGPAWLGVRSFVKTRRVAQNGAIVQPVLGLGWEGISSTEPLTGKWTLMAGPHAHLGVDYMFAFGHFRFGPAIMLSLGSFHDTGLRSVHAWLYGGFTTELCDECSF